MNERIRELAEQAHAQPENLPQYVTLDWKKFAELLIRECVDLCELWNITPGSRLAKEIKQHFGVE